MTPSLAIFQVFVTELSEFGEARRLLSQLEDTAVVHDGALRVYDHGPEHNIFTFVEGAWRTHAHGNETRSFGSIESILLG